MNKWLRYSDSSSRVEKTINNSKDYTFNCELEDCQSVAGMMPIEKHLQVAVNQYIVITRLNHCRKLSFS